MACGNTGVPSHGQTAEKLGGQLNADQVILPTGQWLSIMPVLSLCWKKSKILFLALSKWGTLNLQSHSSRALCGTLIWKVQYLSCSSYLPSKRVSGSLFHHLETDQHEKQTVFSQVSLLTEILHTLPNLNTSSAWKPSWKLAHLELIFLLQSQSPHLQLAPRAWDAQGCSHP